MSDPERDNETDHPRLATGTQDVSNNIVGVSSAANETGETASDVLQSSDGLAAESEALSNEVGRFLARIKAA